LFVLCIYEVQIVLVLKQGYKFLWVSVNVLYRVCGTPPFMIRSMSYSSWVVEVDCSDVVVIWTSSWHIQTTATTAASSSSW